MGKDWLNIRVKTEASKFDAVRSKIQGWPEEVAKEVYWPMLQEIGRQGRDYIRAIILSSTTPTGEQRARNGGNGPGRVKTGQMFDKVSSRARERKTGFSLFVGWAEGRPGYSIFQELGTRNGVIGMNAIAQAEEYMLSQLRAMAAGRYTGSNREISFEDDE